MNSLDWYTLGRVGLLYDFFGALILVWGYVLQGKKEFEEAVSHYGPDVPLAPVTSKFDSIVGFGFIGLGFLAQLAGTDDCASAAFSSCRGCAISALIVLIMGGGSYLLFRKILFARYILYINKSR